MITKNMKAGHSVVTILALKIAKRFVSVGTNVASTTEIMIAMSVIVMNFREMMTMSDALRENLKNHWSKVNGADPCRCGSKEIYGQMGSGCVWTICYDCFFEGPVSQCWADYDQAVQLWNEKIRIITRALGERAK